MTFLDAWYFQLMLLCHWFYSTGSGGTTNPEIPLRGITASFMERRPVFEHDQSKDTSDFHVTPMWSIFAHSLPYFSTVVRVLY
jgi:hypothetical protein